MGSDSSDPRVAALSALACMSRSHLDCAVWPQKLPLILHTNGTSNKIEFRLSNDRPRCLSLPTAEYACCCLIIATACLRRLQLSAVAKRHCVYVDATPVTPSTQKCLQFSLAALSRQRRCLSPPSLIFVQYADIIQMHFKSPIIVAPPIIAVSTVNRNLHL